MDSINCTVNVSHDAEVDAAYIAFPGFENESFPTQVTVDHARLKELGVDVILDLTQDGCLAGIEILGATVLLNGRMLPKGQ
ncbi:DUF2283 domain-containing protein [Aeromicrobium wangtongii]|uniref:DUF2283 domain-containing protein n=1 Tax=Aeromicrobium wangtongii TaxID=2969247 RepID=A0ABY5MDH6_9ACTN|nr:DUF2283 domain-containing protein [Aeromicrobium wangtongii]MCD9197797.1 DUF2283 domain-containing protein [Aeromicrobium wangtongii]UUP15279.1 DUF2283 domain-containing protein [Aeromicrobium wangtongii]